MENKIKINKINNINVFVFPPRLIFILIMDRNIKSKSNKCSALDLYTNKFLWS